MPPGIVKHHEDKLAATRDKMLKEPNTVLMAETLRVLGMLEPEVAVAMIKQKTGKHVRLMDIEPKRKKRLRLMDMKREPFFSER